MRSGCSSHCCVIMQDVSESLRADQGVAFASYTPSDPPTAFTPGTADKQEPTDAAPGLPALCLLKKLTAVPMEGSRTPISADAERFVRNMSRCSTPFDAPTPGRLSDDGSSSPVSDTVTADSPADASCSVTVVASTGSPAPADLPAPAPSCSDHCRDAAADNISNADDCSVFGSELSDDYDDGYGGMQGYPNHDVSVDHGISMQPPVLDNPLFLHNRPECGH